MSLEPIIQRISDSDPAHRLRQWASHQGQSSLVLLNARGSLASFLLAETLRSGNRTLLCVSIDAERAAYLFSDLHQVLRGSEERLILFPGEEAGFYDLEVVDDHAKAIQRTDALQRLRGGFCGIVVTDPRALFDRVVPPEAVKTSTITLSIGAEFSPEQLSSKLSSLGFESVDFVQEPGEMARRGGIVDAFPFTGEFPIRIEFFGDEIDSLREFDPASQRSVSRLEHARLVPNFDQPDHPSARTATLFDYLPDDTIVAFPDGRSVFEEIDRLYGLASEAYEKTLHRLANEEKKNASVFDERRIPSLAPPEDRYLRGVDVERGLTGFSIVDFSSQAGDLAPADSLIDLQARPQPPFHSSVKLLRSRLAELEHGGFECHILCDNRGQESRLYDLLELEEGGLGVKLRVETLHEGFELPELHLAVYTDHQIFNRYHRPSTRKRRKHGGISLRELRDLSAGDFVVHVDYGIGRFEGLETIKVREKQQEAVRVTYDGGDVLYVNVSALYKLHKFTGQEGHRPRLTRLGSGQWERAKSKTKRRVKEIARDLIKLYAERKTSTGTAFSADTVWQRELEASFEYEDTPDQAAASQDVKSDMEQPVPMDRLVCGDVGFGKTEIAVRAAFKAVQEGKQVAVLVPTTILADQHYQTFSRRLTPYPVVVDMLSRFRSPSEQKETSRNISAGKVDILIGTHRAVSKDVSFKDLGLLIIDEEQRFGVRVKERLRKMRPNVDTLFLTATPIPRTLQFSLMGARDLSIISTPPPNRRPILTEIHTFDKDLIRDAILYEVSRGGQVYFIHNRVQTIEEMAAILQELIENVRFQIGHGQMKSSELERVMHAFINHEFDVLVSTNIVESGLDVSNANTMIINHAERFGLADLHQLRGRVGRSDRKAFCYLLTPSIRSLAREARQRLLAVEEFSDLGAGFSIAMRDLDIRGAGNMLGTSQSGFIAEIGFETFHRILDEAVHELRSEEFADVFSEDVAPPPLSETSVDLDVDALLPDRFVSNRLERLSLYRRISEANTSEQLDEIRIELEDRFGPLPEEVDNLLAAADIKLHLEHLRLPRIQFKNQRLFLEMPADKDGFFYSTLFQPLLQTLNTLTRRYVLKESSRKLRIIVQDVATVKDARDVAAELTSATRHLTSQIFSA